MNMPFLCLDLGKQMGWAYGSDAVEKSGSVCLENKRFDGAGVRYINLRRWLDKTKKEMGDIAAVYYESVSFTKSMDAAHTYGGFKATLTAWCEEHSIPYGGISPQQIKMAVTGKGSSSKEGVTKAVKALGHNPADDNEADAIALLTYILGGGL